MFGSGLLQRPLSIRETARRFPGQPGLGWLLAVAPTAVIRTTGKYYSPPPTAIGLTQPRGSQTMVFDSSARPHERASLDCQFRFRQRVIQGPLVLAPRVLLRRPGRHKFLPPAGHFRTSPHLAGR